MQTPIFKGLTLLISGLPLLLNIPIARAEATPIGCNAASKELNTALSDADPAVRLHALQSAEPFLLYNSIDMDKVIALVDDADANTRLEAVRLMRYVWLDKRIAPLERAYKRDGANPEIQQAILGAAKGIEVSLFNLFAKDTALLADERYAPLFRELGSLCVTSGEANYDTMVKIFDALPESAKASGKLIASGFSTGALATFKFDLLKRLVATEGTTGESMKQLIADSRGIAADATSPLPARLNAIGVLSADNFEGAGTVLSGLLAQTQPIEIQSAALRSLAKIGDPQMVPLVLAAWPQLGPEIRQQAMFSDLRKDNYLIALLDAIDSGVIGLDVIKPWGISDLLTYPEIMVRSHAGATLAKLPDTGVKDTVQANYQEITKLSPSIDHGKTLFQENCSKCHFFNGEGNKVGPDLDVKAQAGAYTLLRKLLFPNDVALTFYYSYTVETSDFEQYTGLIAKEDSDAILVRGPSGEEHLVPRENIDSVTCSEKTLMPDGWKDALGGQGLADLIAYLTTTVQHAKVRHAS